MCATVSSISVIFKLCSRISLTFYRRLKMSALTNHPPTEWLYFLQYGTPKNPHRRLSPANEHPFLTQRRPLFKGAIETQFHQQQPQRFGTVVYRFIRDPSVRQFVAERRYLGVKPVGSQNATGLHLGVEQTHHILKDASAEPSLHTCCLTPQRKYLSNV